MTSSINGKLVRHYRCTSTTKLDRTACPSKSVNADSLEAVIVNRISYLGNSEDITRKIVERAQAISNTQLPLKNEERCEFQSRLSKLGSHINNLVGILASEGQHSDKCRGIMASLESLESKRKEIVEQIQVIDREIQKLEGEKLEADVLRSNLNHFGEIFKKLQPEEQRELIRLFVREIHFDGIEKRIKMEIRVLPEPLPDFSLGNGGEPLGSHSVQQSSPNPKQLEPAFK